jgi:hypothetical protein
MINSKKNTYLLKAIDLGYSADRQGNIFNSKGLLVNTYICGKYLYFGHVKVHRFIAYLKFGDIIFSKEVRHLDNNSFNNTWENIGIGSRIDNIFDIPKEERTRMANCGAASVIRLSTDEARNLKNDKKDGFTHKQLCQKYGVSKTTVSEIVNNKTYPQ